MKIDAPLPAWWAPKRTLVAIWNYHWAPSLHTLLLYFSSCQPLHPLTSFKDKIFFYKQEFSSARLKHSDTNKRGRERCGMNTDLCETDLALVSNSVNPHMNWASKSCCSLVSLALRSQSIMTGGWDNDLSSMRPCATAPWLDILASLKLSFAIMLGSLQGEREDANMEMPTR